MSELELKITVRVEGSDIGERVRRLVIAGESVGDSLVLTTDGYALDVVKLERADGLPLSIEEDFSDWFSKNNSGYGSQEREIAYNAYLAGRMAK